jgi:hypothetical protein
MTDNHSNPVQPPQTLEELRAMLTPEAWEDIRRGGPIYRAAMGLHMPERLIWPRSYALGLAARHGLPSDPETVSGLVALMAEAAETL